MADTLTTPTAASILEDGTAICMARVVGATRANVTQASLTSITRKVFDISGSTPDTAIEAGTATLVIVSTIYDTLQTDASWTKDTTGYNFKDIVPASVFTAGGHTYQVEYKITDTGSRIGWVVFRLAAQEVRTS